MTALTQRLLDLGYTELFQRLDDEALGAVWGEEDAPAALKRTALNDEEDPRARFLAAEVILSRRPDAFDDDEKGALGSLYATALRGQFTGSANEWSLPGQPLGRAGEHLLGIGDAAVAGLEALLDDDTPVIYEGSQDAMVGATYAYRVKDLAAQFIAAITGLPFSASTDPATRDEAIAAQRRTLS